MHSVIRVILLGACAAAGVGLAVGLATTLTPDNSLVPGERAAELMPKAPKFKPADDPPKQDSPPAQSVPSVDSPSQAVVVAPVPPPIYAPYHPAVAQSPTAIERALERLQEATERNGDVVLEAIETLQRQNVQPPAPPPAPAPAPVPVFAAQPEAPPAQQPPPAPVFREAPPADAAAPPPEELPNPRAIAHVERGEGDTGLTITVQNADVRKVLEMLSSEAGLNILASKNVSGSISASLVNVDVHTALEALLKSTGFIARREGNFIFVGTPQDLEEMDRTQDVITTRVYRPNYVRAMELQQLITPLLSPNVGKVSVSSASEIDIPADTVKTGGNSFAGSDVLIVRDYEMILRQVDQMVAEIDVQPKQVAIEAMILSVKLDDDYEFGVDFQLLRDQNNVRLVSGSPLAQLGDFELDGDGLRFGFLDASTAVFINALETIGETNVVAAPRVLCLNKQRAEILIGSQLGYVSTTVTENASTQSIEFLEVGTQLRIRPYIFSDGTMRLEVHPELSTGNVRVESGFTLPDKEVTQVTTNVMCRDGSTVIIGGLIREDLTNATSQIPLLGNIPYIGAAFRDKVEGVSRHEIIVLITPRIVGEPQMSAEGRQAQRDFAVRQANYADKMSPIAKRHYARHYLRRAYAAFHAGDNLTALRYANLAVHIDPMNLEANNLRSEVAATMPEYDNRLHNYLKAGLRPGEHPHRDYTKQGFPWSPGNAPDDELPPIVEYDPGVPGTSFNLDAGEPPVRKLNPPTP